MLPAKVIICRSLKKKGRKIRADRLIQALLLLQGRPQVTAAELAAELEVSVPTARRDLEALAMAGIPIYPSRGRGGGWRLIGGARTDLTGLTEGDVTALLLGLTESVGGSAERVAAVRKLIRAIPEPFREGAQRVAQATVREAPWGMVGDDAPPSLLGPLQQAIARGRQVSFAYEGSGGRRELRVVPLVVGSRGFAWYLLAAPERDASGLADDERVRTYRLDRITDLEILARPGRAASSFDVADVWSRMVERVEEMRGAVIAVVAVQPWAVKAMRDRFGAQVRLLAEGEAGADGRVRLEVRAHRVDALAEQLAGWTAAAEVLEPAEVRAAMRELGQRIARAYADEAADSGTAS